MSVITMNISAKLNERPNLIGSINLSIDNRATHVFTVANFTTETSPKYEDPEGDPMESVKVTSLPVKGTLKLSGVDVILDQEITAASIALGNFVYEADQSEDDVYEERFEFTLSDTGSGLFFPIPEYVNFDVFKLVNQRPSEVGDGSINIDYGETAVFTREMFTTQTTPPYSDPEGDAAFILRIDALPNLGEIQLDGVPVGVNDQISFSDIDNELLTYVPDLADTDGDMQGFQFSIADEVSLQFRS